jgi:uncharacterized protein
MYLTGRGVAQDETEAVRWYRKAASQGDAAAQSNLGFVYFNGRGVVQDYAQALTWFKLAGEPPSLPRMHIALPESNVPIP